MHVMTNANIYTMVSRSDRNRLRDLLRSYLNEEITAFTLDDHLDKLSSSEDESVQEIANELWCFYDDCKDHKVVVDKQGWNSLQRMLLFLETDEQIREIFVEKRVYHGDWTQLVALLFLVGLIILHFSAVHWLWLLLIASPPAYLILRRRSRIQSKLESVSATSVSRLALVFPFSGIGHILKHRRSHPNYKKERYPDGLSQRRIRSRVEEVALAVFACVLGLIPLSPVVLLFQCFPFLVREVEVRPVF